MTQLLNRIKILTERLNSLQPIAEDRKKILDKKFRLEFNYNSNHLEGNTLTYGETELLLIFAQTTAIGHEFREYQEMKAHDLAFALIQEWALNKERPLAETDIKELNRIILVEPFWKEAITIEGQPTRKLIQIGDYKQFPNSVRLTNGAIFEYTKPTETRFEMGELIEWLRAEERVGKLHPVELAALFHYKFVRIHPFDDGNGRISRLLMNYILLGANLPTVIIKSHDKKNYLRSLREADAGDPQAFVDYIAAQLVWSLEMSIKAAKGENINEPGDLGKKMTVLKQKFFGDADAKVIERKSHDTVLRLLAGPVMGLLNAWQEKLEEFDVFFLTRNVGLAIDNGGVLKGSSLPHLLQDAMEEIGRVSVQKFILPKAIFFGSTTVGLRKGDKNVNVNAGDVRIEFFDSGYAIGYTGAPAPIEKLYDQILSETEVDSIVETLGTHLYDIVENLLVPK
jgi:Fic family protein